MQGMLHGLGESEVAGFSGRSATFVSQLSRGRQHTPRHRSRATDRKTAFSSRVQASADGNPAPTSNAHLGRDPYSEAGSRLQKLLRGSSSIDSEEVALEEALQMVTPDVKIAMTVVAGAIVATIATALAQLGGSDPWGGASWSLQSVQAALVGAVASLPLIVLRAALWSEPARQTSPALQGLRQHEVEKAAHMMSDMDNGQIAALVLAETVPSCLMIMPAAQGGLTSALSVCTHALRDWGVPLASCAPAAAAMAVATLLAAIPAAAEMWPDWPAIMNIMEAKSNSYRYYESLPQPDAEKAERAFDSVLIAWAESWVGISALALTLSMVDWASLSLLWRATGDLTAPISACFLMHCVDFRFIQQTLRSQQRQRT